MAQISVFVIRHKPTGKYLPEPLGRMGRGGSHVEPEHAWEHPPRLHRTRRSASNYLTSWLRGKVHRSVGQSYEGEYYEDLSIEKISSRTRDEMEIIEILFQL